MLFDQRIRRIAGRTSFSLVLLGAGAAALASSRPAAVAAAIDAVERAVTCNSGSPCSVVNNNGKGPGLQATSAKGIGLEGSGQSYGVQGIGKKVAGVFGTSTGYGNGVTGTAPNGSGLYGKDSSANYGAGVEGYSPAFGVFGSTTTGNGDGVEGYVSGGGVGTLGFSGSGYGLEGLTNEGYGLVAQAYDQGNGIYVAASGQGYGVGSFTNGGLPFFGINNNGNGSDITGTYIGMIGRAPQSGGYPLVLTDQYGDNIFQVDGVGDVAYAGSLYQFARVKGGGSIKSFSTKTTSATVEDTGTAELVDGVAQVRLDPTFAASIDAKAGYRVFVTPGGETRGWLFVATKNSNGFTVREAQAGRSNVTFDYRIVATASGQAGQRMAFVSANGARASLAVVPRLKVAKAKVPATR